MSAIKVKQNIFTELTALASSSGSDFYKFQVLYGGMDAGKKQNVLRIGSKIISDSESSYITRGQSSTATDQFSIFIEIMDREFFEAENKMLDVRPALIDFILEDPATSGIYTGITNSVILDVIGGEINTEFLGTTWVCECEIEIEVKTYG